MKFLQEEMRAGRFKPRDGLPLRVTPISKAESKIYFKLLNPAASNGAALGKKRKHQD